MIFQFFNLYINLEKSRKNIFIYFCFKKRKKKILEVKNFQLILYLVLLEKNIILILVFLTKKKLCEGLPLHIKKIKKFFFLKEIKLIKNLIIKKRGKKFFKNFSFIKEFFKQTKKN